MVFEVRDPFAEPARPSAGTSLSSGWGWLDRQPKISFGMATGSHRTGSIGGGPTLTQFLEMRDPKAWTVFRPPPPLTESALKIGADEAKKLRIGTVELDLIDPFRTLSMATGEAVGREQPTIGYGGSSFDPGAFLGSKQIDLFSGGFFTGGDPASGAPARLLDYPVAWVIAAMQKLQGQPAQPPEVNPNLPYPFQQDPAYWDALGKASTEEDLRWLATWVAGKYVDPGSNKYLVDQLFSTFQKDRNTVLLGLSSGNDRIDYLAKLELQNSPTGLFGPKSQIPAQLQMRGTSVATFLPSLPLFGTQLAEFIDPIRPETEAAWQALDPETRKAVLGDYGWATVASDLVVGFASLSAMGSVLAAAKTAGGFGQLLYRGYDTTLKVTGAAMSVGLAAAVTNWTLEAAVPGYEEQFGKYVDYARPISGSPFAGVVNELGFWTSGTWGAYGLSKGVAKGVGTVTTKVGAPTVRGTRELELFRRGFGGSMVNDMLSDAGVAPELLSTSQKMTFLSFVKNRSLELRRQILEATARGEPTGFAELDALPMEERLVVANEQLRHAGESLDHVSEAIIRVMNVARRTEGVVSNEAERRLLKVATRLSRTLDNEVAARFVSDYGPGWMTRVAGGVDEDSLARFAGRLASSVGGDAGKLRAKGQVGWAQTVRSLYNARFFQRNGQLAAAAEGADEAGKLFVVDRHHVWANDLDHTLGILRKTKSVRVTPVSDEVLAAEALAEAIRIVRFTKEGDEWFARGARFPAGTAHTIENVSPEALADHLEDIAPMLLHRRGLPDRTSPTAMMPVNALAFDMEAEGLWTLAFKTTDVDGTFASHVLTRDGMVFMSPFVDYLDTAAQGIELGKRGYLGSKYDSVFRSWRTWRITEYQRAGLYRSLSRFDFTPSQIDAFHEGVMSLAAKHRLTPQAVGRMPTWTPAGGQAMADDLEALAGRIFGKGPFTHRISGEKVRVHWRDEVGRAYRQSLKLNLTAGVTSQVKSRFGAAGELAVLGSDFIYLIWRFALSPLFKLGEIAESAGFNVMNRVNPRGDPDIEALFFRTGIGNDLGPVATERAFDQMIQGLGRFGASEFSGRGLSRDAAALGWYARQLPQDLEATTLRRTIGAQAAEALARSGGGSPVFTTRSTALRDQLERMVTAEGRVKRGVDPEEVLRIVDELEGRISWTEANLRNRVIRESEIPDTELLTDPYDLKDLQSMMSQQNDYWPDSAGATEFYHVTTALDAVHTVGLKSRKALMAEAWDVEGLRDVLGTIGTGRLFWHDLYTGVERQGHVPAGASNLNLMVNDLTHLDVQGEMVAANQVFKVLDDSGNVVWERTAPVSANMGLGAGIYPDKTVSVTTDYAHANAIADTMRLAIRAARGEVTSWDEVMDHFQPLMDIGMTADDQERLMIAAVKSLTKHLPPPGAVFKWPASNPYATFGWSTWLDSKPWTNDELSSIITDLWPRMERSFRALETGPLAGAHLWEDQLFETIKMMDSRLPEIGPDGQHGGKVVMTGKGSEMRKADPMQVGLLRVAIDPRKLDIYVEALDDTTTPGFLDFSQRSTNVSFGPDPYEIRFPHEAVWTIDDYYWQDDLATDEEGLLRQLGHHLDDAGQPIAGTDARVAEIVANLRQLREARMAPQADTVGGIPGTPEHLVDNLLTTAEEQARHSPKGWARRAWQTFVNPTPFKEHQSRLLQMRLMADWFPQLLASSQMDGALAVFRGLKVPESGWAEWLARDRDLYSRWTQTSDPADLDRLIAHFDDNAKVSGGVRTQTGVEELYESEDWDALTTLWAIAARSAQDEAFGVHFFAPYRSYFERSINHPVLGVYPASWAYKAAKQWGTFLFANRSFGGGELRLGMTPAALIAQAVRAQQSTFASENPETLQEYLETGPLGSSFFIFNLIMPGDWSSIPFPLSRTLRDIARGTVNPLELAQRNLDYLGASRDVRLINEAAGEWGSLILGSEDPDAKVRGWSAFGEDAYLGGEPAGPIR